MKNLFYFIVILVLLSNCQNNSKKDSELTFIPIKKVIEKGSNQGYFGFMDTTGRKAIDFLFDEVKGFGRNNTLAPVKDTTMKWGYINKKGIYVIKPQFDEAFGFAENGLARVKVEKKWGFINEKGDFVIKPQFEQVGPFSEGLAPVRFANKYGYINEKGELVIEPIFTYWSDLIPFVEQPVLDKDNSFEPEYRYIDKFHSLHYFSDGLAVISIKGKLGFIDKKGKIVIEPKFYRIGIFSNGECYATICNDCISWQNKDNIYKKHKEGIINKKGEWIIKPDFYEIGYFENGIAPATVYDEKSNLFNLTKKLGYINKKGKWVIEPKFRIDYYSTINKHSFSEGLAFVCDNDTCGYINLKGNYVIPRKYFPISASSKSEVFSEGLAAVRISKMYDMRPIYQDEGKDMLSLNTLKKSDIGYAGYIDKTGRFVINPRFDQTYPFRNGIAQVIGFEDCGYEYSCFINKKGDYVYYDSLATTRYILK